MTDTTGANCFAEVTAARLLTTTINANTKVARNKPRVTRVTRDRMNTRTVRGEYWLAASWMATRVVAKTTATKANVAAAMVPAKLAAVAGSLTRSNLTRTLAPIRPSNQIQRLANPMAASAKMVGTNHSDTLIRWRKSVCHNGWGCTGSAFTAQESLSHTVADSGPPPA